MQLMGQQYGKKSLIHSRVPQVASGRRLPLLPMLTGIYTAQPSTGEPTSRGAFLNYPQTPTVRGPKKPSTPSVVSTGEGQLQHWYSMGPEICMARPKPVALMTAAWLSN